MHDDHCVIASKPRGLQGGERGGWNEQGAETSVHVWSQDSHKREVADQARVTVPAEALSGGCEWHLRGGPAS